MFKIEINGTDYYTNEISNIIDIEESVNYNKEYQVFTDTIPTNFRFVGGAFTYLFNLLKSNGFCYSLDANIYKRSVNGNYDLIFEGQIKLTDCTFDIYKSVVEVNILNNNWQTRIENNFEIKVPLSAEFSKNSELGNQIPITPISSFTFGAFQFNNKYSGGATVNVNSVYGWRVYDVWDLVVRYISDNNITFQSNFFNNYPPSLDNAITSGEILRTRDGKVPEVSLKQLFDFFKKTWNVHMFFSAQNVLQVEDLNYLRGQNIAAIYDEAKDIKISFDQTYLYSVVKVGDTKAIDNSSEIADNYHFPIIEGSGYNVQTFNVQTECNINSILDLTVDEFIYDHNVLEKIIVEDDTSYDNELLIISYNRNTNAPTGGDLIGLATSVSAPTFYNQWYMNNMIVSRHEVYGNLTKANTDGNDTFLALNLNGNVSSNYNSYSVTFAGVPISATPLRYANDFSPITYPNGTILTPFDNNNNYGNSTSINTLITGANSKFICPSSGLYSFEATCDFDLIPYGDNWSIVYFDIVVTDNVGTELYRRKAIAEFRPITSQYVQTIYYDNVTNSVTNFSYVYSNIYNNNAYQYTVKFRMTNQQNLYLSSTNRVFIEVTLDELDGNRGTGFMNGYGGKLQKIVPDYFTCSYSVNGGSISLNALKSTTGLKKISFEKLLTNDEIEFIKLYPYLRYGVRHDNVEYFGNIRNIRIDHKTNICNFELTVNE